MVTGVARLPRLVAMNNEVEMDTRHEVIRSMEGSSFPEKLFVSEREKSQVFVPAALKASFARLIEAISSKTGSKKAEKFIVWICKLLPLLFHLGQT